MTEGYSVRQLIRSSGHSKAKIFRIINYWLSRKPPVLSHKAYEKVKYILFDGTYFHKDGCLAILMDAVHKRLLNNWYIQRESYYDVYPKLCELKKYGLNPKAITLDGHKKVTAAFISAWPQIIIQRCLFHIENQGLMWIRSYPKSEAGQKLRIILKSITEIRSKTDERSFLTTYRFWLNKYASFIQLLPQNSVANKDLKRTMALINNALPNMFHFIKDQNIVATTNLLENFYSQLKHQSRQHKIAFLDWYCYFKSFKKTNIL